VSHAAAIAAYSRHLADRIGAIIDAGEFPVVLGGDCSVLIGAALAMHRLGEAVGGQIGLVYVDGHSDFRHPGNAAYVGAAAGEGLALVTGRGQGDLAAIEGRRPYFRDADVVVLGIRGHDEYRLDLQAAGIVNRQVPALRAEGAPRSAQWARDQLTDCAGYWLHVDVDVLDPAVMPAVDAPEPGGIAFTELESLLTGLVSSPHCLGLELTVFDPDYDPDGRYAAELVETLVTGLSALRGSGPPAEEPPSGRGRQPRARTRAGRRVSVWGEAPAGAGDAVEGRGGAPASPRRDRDASGQTGDDPGPGRLRREVAGDPGAGGDAAQPGRLRRDRDARDDAAGAADGGPAVRPADEATRPGRLRRDRPASGGVAPAPRRSAAEAGGPLGGSPAGPAGGTGPAPTGATPVETA
jgi:arginase